MLFKDADTAGDTEDNASDLLFKAINVTDSIYKTDSVRFKVSSGDYQICFVANPSAGLFDGLTAGSSSVANFKALVETKAPDTKPGMLMTSDFHKATVTTNDSININTVTLERAMARIDIVNKADGITIDSVKLANRATNSVLINDGEKKAEALKDTTYKDVSLAGKADGSAAYKARIYSYEQYGTDNNAPSMEVYYRIGEKKYTHTIKFVTKGENDAETQINLKRNYLYTVNITNNAGKLTFVLTVADWNKGTTFEVTSEELIGGFDNAYYDNAALGDIMLADGTFVKPDNITDDQKSQAVGIVAYLYKSDETRIGAGVKAALAKMQRTPHGLVLALKNATASSWSSSAAVANSGYLYTSLKDAYNGADGYTLTENVLNSTTLSLSTFTVFQEVKTFRDSHEVTGTVTDWYLPSIGEWMDIMSKKGIGGVNISSIITSTEVAEYTDSPTAPTVCSTINDLMEKVGSGYYDKFAEVASNNSCGLLSSTERNDSNVYAVFFYDNYSGTYGSKIGFDANVSKTYNGDNTRRVRCILAF